MKKYLAILLTIAMTACVVEPTPDTDPVKPEDPKVDQFILNARGAYTLNAISSTLVDTVATGEDYSVGDIIKDDKTVLYAYKGQSSEFFALYLNPELHGKYSMVEYKADTATLVFYGPYDDEVAANTAIEAAVAGTPPTDIDTNIPVVVIDPFVIEGGIYIMPNSRTFVVSHTADKQPEIGERAGSTTTSLYTYVKGLNKTQAIFKTIAGNKFVGVQNGILGLSLYATDGDPENTWDSAGKVRFTDRHLYVSKGPSSGDGGGINVPDNGTGYYTYAKKFTGFGNIITNKDPVVSWLHPQKTENNAIKDSIGSRIPSMITLPSGRIVISGDIRWTGNGDLPHKTDNFSRYSDTGGNSWSKIRVLHKFNDFDTDTFANINKASSGTDKSAGQIKIGAAAADAAIGRAKDGTIIAIATAGAHSTGNADVGYGAQPARPYKEFSGKTYLMLREKPDVNINNFSISSTGAQSSGSTREDTELDNAKFKYGIEVNMSGIETKAVRQLQEFTFNGRDIASAAPVANVYIDEKLYVWKDAQGTSPFNVKQLGVTTGYKYEELAKTTQAHLFYMNSPYWPFRRYTHVTMSRSTDDGASWNPQADVISHLVRAKGDAVLTSRGKMAGMFFISPTAGYLKRFGNNKGRLFFSAYSSGQGGGPNKEHPMIFWTDDAGKSWDSADDFIAWGAGVNGSSETAIVEAPDGTLIAVSRAAGTGAGASYATSKDSGKTWTESLIIPKSGTGKPGLDALGSNQLFAVNLSQWKGVNGEPLVAFSHASESLPRRSNGKITIAALVKDTTNPARGWTFDFSQAFGGTGHSINYTAKPSNHDYSVVVEKLDGNLGIYYEGARVFESGAAGMALDFNTVEMVGQ